MIAEWVKRHKKIVFITLFMVIGYQYTAMHELIHYQIYDKFGCNVTEIYVLPWAGYVGGTCENASLTLIEELSIHHLNVMNEIVSYNALFLAMFMLFLYVMWKWR